MRIFSTRFKCFETENTTNSSLRTSPTFYMALSQRITQVGKDPYLLELSELHQSVSTCSPSHVDRLYFLLRREPTVRTAENLERKSFLSLSKNLISTPTVYFLFSLEKRTICFCLYSIKLFINSFHVPFVLIFDTWLNPSYPSHPLSTHATCVTWVHVVGDFFHITCLSRVVLRHPTLGASKNVKLRLSRNFNEIRRGS